jgi:hypothetical protein
VPDLELAAVFRHREIVPQLPGRPSVMATGTPSVIPGALPVSVAGEVLEVRRTQAFLAVREDRMEAGIRSADLTVHLVSQVRALVDSAIHLSLGLGSGRDLHLEIADSDRIHRCLVARGSTPHAASTDSLVLATEHSPADSEHTETFSEVPASGVVSVSAGALASIAASASGGGSATDLPRALVGVGAGAVGVSDGHTGAAIGDPGGRAPGHGGTTHIGMPRGRGMATIRITATMACMTIRRPMPLIRRPTTTRRQVT